MPETRRLAAILAADVVGYSRLMEADETGTLRRLKEHQAAIFPIGREHGGRIVGTAGDGLLVEFPSTIGAVRAAVRIQATMESRNSEVADCERMFFRIGINLGDILATDDGDIFGNGVNVAARLESLATPGGICISQAAHEQVRDALDFEFEDAGDVEVKNIKRPIHVWRWPSLRTLPADKLPPNIQQSADTRPSVMVLPFDNMSADPDQDFFADGLTEDIITELARFPDLVVIARNTSFSFRGGDKNVASIAAEVDVEFVIEGSVRRSGSRVRITAQLIEGTSGKHIWAERFDGALEDMFELQAEMTSRIVASISPQFQYYRASGQRTRRQSFGKAEILAWKAEALFLSALRNGTRDEAEQGIEFAKEALLLDSDCKPAYHALSNLLWLAGVQRWSDDLTELRRREQEISDHLIATWPEDYQSYFRRAMANIHHRGARASCLADLRHAHSLNPNDSLVLIVLSATSALIGQSEDAIRYAEQAERLTPKDFRLGTAHLARAMAAFQTEDLDELKNWAEKAIQAQPNVPMRRTLMIYWGVKMGRPDVVAEHRNHLEKFAPDFIKGLFQGDEPWFDRPEHNEKLLDGLREASLEPPPST